MSVQARIDALMDLVKSRSPHEPEFHQAVHEVAGSVAHLVEDNPAYADARILERLVEPDRVVIFRVTWMRDDESIAINRGYRVQFNGAIGPYKGGLRFHPSVTLSVLKFLGFEQIFKNSLTGLPMGGGKGGSDFNPKGRSDAEVMRFCQSFMIELHRHIGPDTDVPAGDIGVGAREVGYLFGQYRRLANAWTGTMTGKGIAFGGSRIRTEATGYGSVYFAQNMLHHISEELAGKTCTVSGSGNVALYTIEKALAFGAKVVTASDSGGFIHDPEGFDAEKLAYLKNLKEVERGRISEYAKKFKGATFTKDQRPWSVPCDVAFPSATQNEIGLEDAKGLAKNGCRLVCEGANMPSTAEAIDVFHDGGILFAPGKAANAGGVTVSGLEMMQNAGFMSWTHDAVEQRLAEIMRDIHATCVQHGQEEKRVNYLKGANVGAFLRVAEAMLAQGAV